MNEKELGSIKGWFAGRLPDGWFTGVEVSVEDDQVVVLGTLPALNVGSTPEEKEGAAAGRIARFREETRGERIGIAREAEERFHKYITWGAKLDGVTKRFNPGGGGGGGRSDDRRSVMIRRWMRRHGRQHAGQPEKQSQVFYPSSAPLTLTLSPEGEREKVRAEYMLPSQRLGTVRRSLVLLKPARAAIFSHRS